MREEKPKSPSQKKISTSKKSWFWPIIYSSIAVLFVGMIWGYNAFLKEDGSDLAVKPNEKGNDEVVVDVNAATEVMKYPFKEALLDKVSIVQEYYDTEASDEARESALLVSNQTYITNTGISISVDGQPFEVLAAQSGKVENIVNDPFKGNEITIAHTDGVKTIYRSVTGILVKKDDEVVQGQPIASSTENEWNPTAGIHLHFEVQKEEVAVNPRLYLGF